MLYFLSLPFPGIKRVNSFNHRLLPISVESNIYSGEIKDYSVGKNYRQGQQRLQADGRQQRKKWNKLKMYMMQFKDSGGLGRRQ